MFSFVNIVNKFQIQLNNQINSNLFSSLKCQFAPYQPYQNINQLIEIREKYKTHQNDTGSPEYQIASLSAKIAYLTIHVKKNPKDFSSTRGLIAMVSVRKKLLKYLRMENKDRFLKICMNLKIRIQKDQQ
nr:plastidial 30S ribosomal protein S15 [Cryptomonas sp.]